MKRILMPLTSKIHWARNQLLLNELKNYFEVHLATYGEKEMPMTDVALDIGPKFKYALDTIKPDLVLIRADRAELLPCAMLSVYGGYKVAQLESGDLSGTWDNKIRFAISHLSDIHFTTNDDSQKRMLSMGFENVWNEGSLDCEYALSVKPQNAPQKKYLVVLYHSIPNEPQEAVLEAVETFKDEYAIVGVRGNRDYGVASSYQESYPPEQFIQLLKGASCIIGNSSCLIKECSVLSVPAVLVGSRQANRLRTKNVLDVPCETELIKEAITFQLKRKFERDDTYYIPETSKRIAKIIFEHSDQHL